MSLKDFYYRLEDKYFDFLDKLDRSGIKVYKIIDPLEKKGIHTFAIFNLIVFAIIILLIVHFTGITGPVNLNKNSELTLNFLDDSGNILANQTIDINLSGIEKTVRTDESGIAKINNLDPKEQYELTLNDLQYTLDNPITIDLSDKQVYILTLSESKELVSKTIEFKQKSSGELITEDLEVSFSCSNNEDYYKENILVSDGIYVLDDVPADCGVLIPNILDYDQVDEENLDTENQEVGEVFLSPLSGNGVGEVSITVVDKETSLPVPGIEVSLYTNYGTIETSGTSGQNGLVSFSSVKEGDYYINAYDNSGIYGEVTPNDGVLLQVVPNTVSELILKLNKDIVGKISLKIIDIDTSESISGVSVNLLKGEDLVTTGVSDEDGLVTFNVKENIPYNLSFDHPDYIKNSKSLRISNSVQSIYLKRVDQETISAVYVSVIDNEKQPIGFANLKLIDIETNTIIKTITTDIRGQAIISNLDPSKTYKIQAVVGKYSKETLPFSVTERNHYDETIIMDIGEGTYNLQITDSSGTPISTGISVYDSSTDLELQNKRTNTDNEGKTILRIRADKTIYFVIDNYDSKFITTKYHLDADNSKKINIKLPRVITTSNVEYQGLFDSKGQQITSVSPGQTVKARFLLNVNNDYSLVVAHIRTGSGDKCDNVTHTLEEDNIYIKEVRFAGRKIIGSTSYTPCLGEHKDLSSLTKRDGKWFDVILDNPLQGTYLIEADLVILDSAIGTLPLYYRGEFHRGNAVLRKPIDTKLGTSLETSEKQGLYAYSKEATIYTGASNFCNSSLCYNFSILNKSNNITKNIIDKYTTKANTSHKMYFSINVGNRAIPNSILNLSSSGTTIKLNEYLIDGVGSQIISGESFDSIELGNLGANDHISGEVEFDVVDDKSDTFNFNLISNGENIFTKNILINVIPSKSINLEIIPRVFLPFVPNNVAFSIIDDENKVVPFADVVVKLNDNTITVGKTNEKGIFGFVLPGPNLGDTLELIVNKEGYKRIDNKYKIDNKLLSTIPEDTKINLNISESYFDYRDISLENDTALPLAIKSIGTTINSKYVSLKLNTEKQIIDSGEQAKLNIITSLTEEGLDLIQQKEIVGDIIVVVNNAQLSKSWTVKIPINIRITFGDSLDNIDCLIIKPNLLNIKTEPEKEVEYSLKISNKCTIHNKPIALGSIVSTLNLENYKNLGQFNIFVNNKKYELKPDEDIAIIRNMKPNQKLDLKLTFKSKKIKSGKAEPKILFKSVKPTTSGADKIQSELTTKIVINKYSECIEFKPKGPIPVLACMMDYGMSMYGAQGNYNTLGSQMRMPGYYQGYMNSGYGYNPMMAQGMYGYGNTTNAYVNNYVSNLYPGQNLANLYNARYGQDFLNMLDYPIGMQGMGMPNNIGCPQQEITVTNKCTDNIDLKLEAEQGINVISPAEFSLDKGESSKIKIVGGHIMGIFNLSAYAKSNEDIEDTDDEDYKLVKEIPIKVTLPIQDIPHQCIHLSKDKLDFSSLKSDFQTLDIINTCVDYGYRLSKIKIKDFNSIEYNGIQFLAITNSLGELEPINKMNGETKDHKNVEVWTIKLRRNPEIGTFAAKRYMDRFGTTRTSNRITMIRKLNEIFGKAINLNAIISVGVRTPNLRQQAMYKDFPITLKDNLQWLAFTDDFFVPGEDQGEDQDTEPTVGSNTPTSSQAPKPQAPESASKIPKEIITDISNSSGLVQVKLSQNTKNRVIIKIDDELLKEDKFTEVNGYGKVCFKGKISSFPLEKITDKSYIKDKESTYFYSGDVLVNILFSKKQKNYTLCIFRPLRGLTSKESQINNFFRNKFNVYNPKFFSLFSKRIYDDVSIAVVGNLERKSMIEGVDLENINYDDSSFKLNSGECLDPYGFKKLGFTGEENYNRFGFNRLLFRWNPEDITETTCDAGNYYCDQTQFYYYLNKKAENIYDYESKTYTVKTSSEFTKLGDVYFLLDSEDKSIRKVSNIRLKDISEDIKSKFDNLSTKDIDNYLAVTKDIIKNIIPNDLKDLTVITVSNKVSEDNLDIVTPDNFNKFIYAIFGKDNVYINQDNLSFTAQEYSKDMSDYSTLKNKVKDLEFLKTNDNLDGTKLNKYLSQFLETMNIYYGASLNKFIVDIKPFGNLESEDNKRMMILKSFFNQNMLDISLDSSGLTKIENPKSYLVSISVSKNSLDNKYKINMKINNLSNILKDEIKDNIDYKNNILFYTSLNPTYYTYNEIPFVKGNEGSYKINGVSVDNYAKNYKDYTNWKEIQEGYIFTVKNSNSGMKIIKYADIRPIKTITKGNELLYNLSHSNNIIKEPHNWLVGDILLDNEVKDNFNTVDKLNTLTLTQVNPLRTTFFVLAKDNTLTSGNNYQLDIASKTEMKFISGIVTEPADYDSILVYKYHVPKDIRNSFSGLNYNTIESIIDLIKENNVCFESNSGELKLWTNPNFVGSIKDITSDDFDLDTVIGDLKNSLMNEINNYQETYIDRRISILQTSINAIAESDSKKASKLNVKLSKLQEDIKKDRENLLKKISKMKSDDEQKIRRSINNFKTSSEKKLDKIKTDIELTTKNIQITNVSKYELEQQKSNLLNSLVFVNNRITNKTEELKNNVDNIELIGLTLDKATINSELNKVISDFKLDRGKLKNKISKIDIKSGKNLFSIIDPITKETKEISDLELTYNKKLDKLNSQINAFSYLQEKKQDLLDNINVERVNLENIIQAVDVTIFSLNNLEDKQKILNNLNDLKTNLENEYIKLSRDIKNSSFGNINKFTLENANKKYTKLDNEIKSFETKNKKDLSDITKNVTNNEYQEMLVKSAKDELTRDLNSWYTLNSRQYLVAKEEVEAEISLLNGANVNIKDKTEIENNLKSVESAIKTNYNSIKQKVNSLTFSNIENVRKEISKFEIDSIKSLRKVKKNAELVKELSFRKEEMLDLLDLENTELNTKLNSISGLSANVSAAILKIRNNISNRKQRLEKEINSLTSVSVNFNRKQQDKLINLKFKEIYNFKKDYIEQISLVLEKNLDINKTMKLLEVSKQELIKVLNKYYNSNTNGEIQTYQKDVTSSLNSIVNLLSSVDKENIISEKNKVVNDISINYNNLFNSINSFDSYEESKFDEINNNIKDFKVNSIKSLKVLKSHIDLAKNLYIEKSKLELEVNEISENLNSFSTSIAESLNSISDIEFKNRENAKITKLNQEIDSTISNLNIEIESLNSSNINGNNYDKRLQKQKLKDIRNRLYTFTKTVNNKFTIIIKEIKTKDSSIRLLDKFKTKLHDDLLSKKNNLDLEKEKLNSAINSLEITDESLKQDYINSLHLSEYYELMEVNYDLLTEKVNGVNLDNINTVRNLIIDYYLKYMRYFKSVEKEIRIINIIKRPI